jgi:Tol biopolymer transport system component
MKYPFIKSIHIITLISLINIFTSCSENSVDHSDPPVAEYTQVDFEPSWSPDAVNIVYSHADIDNEYTGIYIINSNGSNNRLIVSDFARCPYWSSDGQWIVFTQFDQIFKIKISDNTILQLTSGGKNFFPKWCPDSSLIAYSNSINTSDYNIMIMNTDGNQKRLIDENANYPGWENGSSSLIYFKPAKFNGVSQNGDTLVRYLFSDSSKQTITVLNGNDHLVNMYPVFAGDRYIFCSADNSGSVYIYSMDLDGKNIVKLTTGQSYSPDYSFVRNKIAYTNRTLGNGRLWIMDKNGHNKMQVTN